MNTLLHLLGAASAAVCFLAWFSPAPLSAGAAGEDAAADVADAIEERGDGFVEVLGANLGSELWAERTEFPSISAEEWRKWGFDPAPRKVPLGRLCERVLNTLPFEEVRPGLLAVLERVPADAEVDGVWRDAEREQVAGVLWYIVDRYRDAAHDRKLLVGASTICLELTGEQSPRRKVRSFPGSLLRADLPPGLPVAADAPHFIVTRENLLPLARRTADLAIERRTPPPAAPTAEAPR